MSEEKIESVLKYAEELINEWNDSLKNCSYLKKTIEDMPPRVIIVLALMEIGG